MACFVLYGQIAQVRTSNGVKPRRSEVRILVCPPEGDNKVRDGLLWFDNSDRSLADKIERAAEYFKTKYGERPDLCFVNASALLRELPALDGIEVRGTNSVYLTICGWDLATSRCRCRCDCTYGSDTEENMKIYRLRNKRNKNRFYTRGRRSFFRSIGDLKMSLRYDTEFISDYYEIVEYDLIEKAKYPAPGRDELAPLTYEDVLAIRKEHAVEGTAAKALAYKYRVSKSTIHRILHRESWWQETD